MNFTKLLSSDGFVILDGGMGTMLQKRGLPPGSCSESASLLHPDWVEGIHRDYVSSGSMIVYANTFGANRDKLAESGLTPEEVIPASIACAKRACAGSGALVALDLGPTGQLLEPNGSMSFDHCYELYAQQVRLGAAAGADVAVIETMGDLLETKAALLAVKENSDLPVICSMSFELTGRTFVGCGAASMALTLEGLGADAVGINCSLGPREMPALVEELLKWTELPLIVKPNAGLPNPDGSYDLSPDEFAEAMVTVAKMGVKLLGGCCGTDPSYIAALRDALCGLHYARPVTAVPPAVCSGRRAVAIDRVRVIGERINPTGKKRFKQALLQGDADYILSQALEQLSAGADILDVNVGLPEIDEPSTLRSTVKAIQGITDAPLQIDSSDPAALEAALRVYCGKPIVNSVNGSRSVLDTVLPLVKRYGAAVVGLTLDEGGVPQTADERFAIAERIVNAALSFGIRREDVYIDCLTLTVSAEPDAARETLKALGMVKHQLGVKTVLGVSNISFGLPARQLVNQNFLAQALYAGLDLPIINPNTASMMAAVRVYHLLGGFDPDARDYVGAYAGASVTDGIVPAAQAAASAAPKTLTELIISGLCGEAAESTRRLLETTDSLEIIDTLLTPALDKVGADFEAGRAYLPQLIQAANAAQAAFGVIREHMQSSSSAAVSKGVIVIATVKGDVHDIGKNIVRVLLENYGYTVIDLGKDVEPQAIVDAVREHSAPLLGLSALMTTTLKSMEETIALVRSSGLDCKIMVGGAVLTAEYAQKIGADYYSRDAKESADIARRVFGA